MNRQLKFRLWNPDANKFHYDVENVYDCLKAQQIFEGAETRGFTLPYDYISDGFVWEQFTGLHDKNGKDIYEGDILKFHYFYQSFGENMGASESEHELSGIVEWQEYGYGISAIKGEHWNGYTGYSDGEGSADFIHLAAMSESSIHEESFEIIGNIHQNPELLNS